MAKKSTVVKEEKDIFVIMPFRITSLRNKAQLTSFFEDQLKKNIERGRFKYKYIVRRSDDSFNITDQIIKDVFSADIVICDLSGKDSNPNVMYELGMRLSLTNNPTILIRESNPENKTIFDISGFYAHPYDPLNYDPLIQHLKEKIKKFEDGSEVYRSPVLKIAEEEVPLLEEMSFRRARELLLFMRKSIEQVRRLFIYKLRDHAKIADSTLDFGDKFDQVVFKLNDQWDEFSKIDWESFHWTFSSQPIIDAYLANQYLNNILDPRIVAHFSMFIITYHAHYLGTDVFHYKWNEGPIFMYLGETEILCQMIDTVRKALDDCTNEEIDKLADHMEVLKNESNLKA